MKSLSRLKPRSIAKLVLVALIATVLAPLAAHSQAVSARLVGGVEDTTKARVAGATVEAKNDDSGIVIDATTDESGEYTFAHILPGRYTVVASANGFEPTQINRVELQIGDAKTLDISLSLKTVVQTIQVVDSAPTIDTGTTHVGAVVNDLQAVDLPLNGRDAMTLIYLQAGTNPLDNQNSSGSQQEVGVVDGLPPGTSEVRVEGILSTNATYDYSPAHPSFPVPSEAVGEYRVSTSGNGANDGPSAGAEVKVLIKSGTDQFHGSLYEFVRNTVLDANDFFDNRQGNPRAVLQRNQFGFAFGGPIRKNKLFFFVTGEMQRQIQDDPEEATVLSDPMRQGIFRYSPGAKNSVSEVNPQTGAPLVPVSTINLLTVDPTKQGADTVYLPYVLSVMPEPNAWDVGDGLNTAGYRYQSKDFDNYLQGLAKVDYVINSRNTLAITASQYIENDPQSLQFNGVRSEGYSESRRGISLRLTTTASATFSNELSIGSALRFASRANTTTTCEGPQNNFTLTSVASLCDNRSAQVNPALTKGLSDVATKVIGKHTFEFGGEYWRETLNRTSGTRYPLINTSNSNNPANVPALTGLNTTDRADAQQWVKSLTGYVGSITQTFYIDSAGQYTPYAPLKEELRKNEFGFYGSDAWRVTPRLSVNLGLRWDILPPAQNLEGYAYPVGGYNGALGVSGPLGVPTAWQLASNHGGSVYNTDYHAFSPSIGLVWDPFGNAKSAIRASYKISNVRTEMITQDLSELENGSSTSVTTTPNVRLANLNSVLPIATPQPFQTPANVRQGTVVVDNPNLTIPYAQEWTFGLERVVARNFTLSATYIGNHAVGMWRSSDLNQVQIRSNGFLNAFLIAQANLAANGSPTNGQSLGSLQSLFAEVPAGEYTVITQGQAASLANYLDTTAPTGGARGQLVTNAGLPATFFRLNPQFSDVYTVGNYGQSTWNALQLELKHKLQHGLYLQANYTLSKGFVNYPQDEEYYNANPFRDINNPGLDRTLSPLDSTHVILINGLYELPFGHGKAFGHDGGRVVNALIGGWQVNGIFNFTTGRPISFTTGYDQLNQVVASTPNFTHAFSNLSQVTETPTTVTYISAAEKAAFSNPVPGSPGGMRAYELHGPGYSNFDASLFRSFHLPKLGEKTQLQIRGELFNVFNHTNFVAGSANINSGSFGNITSARAPRVGQLAAKITF
jgi:hypothetical protein